MSRFFFTKKIAIFFCFLLFTVVLLNVIFDYERANFLPRPLRVFASLSRCKLSLARSACIKILSVSRAQNAAHGRERSKLVAHSSGARALAHSHLRACDCTFRLSPPPLFAFVLQTCQFVLLVSSSFRGRSAHSRAPNVRRLTYGAAKLRANYECWRVRCVNAPLARYNKAHVDASGERKIGRRTPRAARCAPRAARLGSAA